MNVIFFFFDVGIVFAGEGGDRGVGRFAEQDIVALGNLSWTARTQERERQNM